MNNTDTRKKVSRSISILAIGALLMGGGLFLWQNEFNLNFFSGASNSTVQAVISLGEKSSSGVPVYATAVSNELQKSQGKTIEVVSRAEVGTTISTLRDQAVLGYNDITKPITDHIVFVVVTGKTALVKGVNNKDSVAAIANRVAKEISSLVELASARPGVFPNGYTILLATLPDPLDGTGNAALCKGLIPNYGVQYTKGVVNELNNTLKSTAAIYPLNIKIVDLEKAFQDHGLESNESWFLDCQSLNEKGLSKMSELFSLAAAGVKK